MEIKITLVILSGLCLLLFISNWILIYRCNTLKKQNNILAKEKSDAVAEKNKIKEDVTAIIPGDRVTLKTTLVHGQTKTNYGESFDVQYEATVIEVSETQVKVDPYECKAITKLPNAVSKVPNYMKQCCDVYKNNWVDRSRVLLDKEDIRQHKIDKILKS